MRVGPGHKEPKYGASSEECHDVMIVLESVGILLIFSLDMSMTGRNARIQLERDKNFCLDEQLIRAM